MILANHTFRSVSSTTQNGRSVSQNRTRETQKPFPIFGGIQKRVEGGMAEFCLEQIADMLAEVTE